MNGALAMNQAAGLKQMLAAMVGRPAAEAPAEAAIK